MVEKMSSLTLELDDEALKCIDEFEVYMGDESYSHHLADKILRLYKEQS